MARRMLPAEFDPGVRLGEEGHKVLHWLRINKRFSSDPQRMAKDTDCIRFFEAYWPEPSPLASGSPDSNT